MLTLLTFLSYVFMLYGCASFFVYRDGIFNCIDKFRKLMEAIHPTFGDLFKCIFCTSCWLSIIFSILNFILIPVIPPITPFNIILEGTGLWYIIALLDMFFGSAVCWLLHLLDDFLENNSKAYEDQ